MNRNNRLKAPLVALMVLNAAASSAEDNSAPASTITETFANWTVQCRLAQDQKKHICAMTQQQVTKERQRVLAAELKPSGDTVDGTLVLPFGLALAKGVNLRIGAAKTGTAYSFSTCVPAGCIVPMHFDAEALALLVKSKALNVEASQLDGQGLEFEISLTGFAAAFDRLQNLTQ